MLSARLSYLRKISKKTQEDMANLLGITRPAYTAYESGRRQPDYETLQKLADFFGTTTDYLLGRSDDPKQPSTANPKDLEGFIRARFANSRVPRKIKEHQLQSIANSIKLLEEMEKEEFGDKD